MSSNIKALLTVTARNEDQIRLLVHNTKGKYPILYDPKSGINLKRTALPPDPGSMIPVIEGADCTNLIRLHALGCFELVSGAIFPVTELDGIAPQSHGIIVMFFNQDVYTNALRSDEIVVKINDVTIDPSTYSVVNMGKGSASKAVVIQTYEDIGLDQEIEVELTETGAGHILGLDDVAVEPGIFSVVSALELSSGKELTEFEVGYVNGGTTTTYPGTIDVENKLITMTAQRGTDRSTFFQVFEISEDARILHNNDYLLSNAFGADYSQEVQFLLQAQNGLADMWTVRCGIEASLMFFAFLAVNNEGVILEDVEATIDHAAKTVAISVPNGTVVTALVPNFNYAGGTSVKIGEVAQTSGTTANDFTNPVVYTVTDGAENTNDYTVTVTVLPA